MFVKKAQFKPFSAVKGSVRKSFAAHVATELHCELTTEERDLVLPKSLQTAKCTTHGGNRAEVCIDESRVPLWVTVGSKIVPTVATVAAVPHIVPTLQTVIHTLQYLQNGADFMGPGLFGEIPCLRQGQVVQIRALEGNVLATGIMLKDITPTGPNNGKVVQVISVVNDTLVSIAELRRFASAGLSLEAKKARLAATSGTDQVSPEITAGSEDAFEQSPPAAISTQQTQEAEHQVSTVEDRLSQDEIDQAFVEALEKVLTLPHVFPIPMAQIASEIKQHLPYEHEDLQIKNSKFKKMQTLLKDAAKQDKLALKTRQGGEMLVQSIKQAPTAPAVPLATAKTTPRRAQAVKMDAFELFVPKSTARGILGDTNTSQYLKKREIHKALSDYADQNQLARGAEISIDSVLARALCLKQGVSHLPRAEAQAQFLKSFNLHHALVLPGDDTEAPLRVRKGPIPTVFVRHETRGGNKSVTIVRNVSAFGLDAKTIAGELAVKCASSATTQPAKAGSEAGKDGLEVLVQGRHSSTVAKVLESKGLRPQWIAT